MHPIKGYGPSLSDQGYGPEDAPLVSGVTNCGGCQIEYHRETGAATLLYCADHDAEHHECELEEAEAEGRQLYTALRRMADGAHDGDYADAKAALDQATVLLRRLAERYAR